MKLGMHGVSPQLHLQGTVMKHRHIFTFIIQEAHNKSSTL